MLQPDPTASSTCTTTEFYDYASSAAPLQLHASSAAPLLLQRPETTQTNYVKIIRSISGSSAADLMPSVVDYIMSNTNRIERSELIQELAKKMKDPEVVKQLSEQKLLHTIISQLLDIFNSEASHSIQFEIMTIICSFPQSYLSDKLLSKLHSAALSSSPLIRQQSLILVLKTLPYDVSLKFLLAYLDDDDPRVRTTAIQHLVKSAETGGEVPYSVYNKIITNLSDEYEEVRLHSVRLLPYLVTQHKTQHLELSSTSRRVSLTHHTFVQLCMLMRDISTNVRSETARVLGTFKHVDMEYLKQTLDKKVKSTMKIMPSGKQPKQEYSSGRVWQGDAPINSVRGEILLFEPAGCGAFIHGMEDEYHEVRSNTIQSMCGLAAECPEFGAECMAHLVDMLNDEIQGVRLLAIVSLQSISENVHLHEDQLETVMSVLDELNVEMRHSLHQLLSSCRLNSQVAVRRVLKGLLDNLKKYPQDKTSIYRCVKGVGSNNASFVALLAPEMLSKHPYLAQTEPSTDDTSYIATMILVFNAAKYNSVMFSFFHDYTPKHYVYIYSLFPDLVPQLPQVHKILKSLDSSTDTESIVESLNLLLRQCFGLSSHISTMTKTLENIQKIQRCSKRIHPQTEYASKLIIILLRIAKLRLTVSKQRHGSTFRVLAKIKDIVYELCYFETCFSGPPQLALIGKLLKLYFIQFLRNEVSVSEVTSCDLERYRDHVISYAIEYQLTIPPQIREDMHFNITQFLLEQSVLVSSNITQSVATILSPQSNTDRVNEFPSHLSFSVQVEAETSHVDPGTLAVRITYPGSHHAISQPGSHHPLRDYYQNTVFLGASSWSDPGLVGLCLVREAVFGAAERCLARLYGREQVWLGVSEGVKIKIHPRPSR